MKDKREECGCHKECTYDEHKCEKPCEWPGCLTPDESKQWAEKIARDLW